MEHAGAFLEMVAKQVDPGAPGFWRDFLVGMLKPVAATAVVAMAVALSFSQRLGLEGEMLYAIARAFLQLSVIGFVLQFIFTQKNALWILLAYLFMVTIAGYTAGQRAKQVPRGKYIACVSILVGTAITMFLLVVLNVFPFTPRYIIPVAGMMVGNAMTVTGVTMKKLREDVKIQRNLVSSDLICSLFPICLLLNSCFFSNPFACFVARPPRLYYKDKKVRSCCIRNSSDWLIMHIV
jgi:putative ABC transport system permease protein